jgi:SAM-dependent methyltransferase
MIAKPIAYDAYQQLADQYAALIDIKPHNAYCERPAMIAMWPALADKRVLDAGCGPGVYNQLLCERRANVTSIDVSDRMIELARRRLGPTADLRLMDLTQPLDQFASGEFDFVNAPVLITSKIGGNSLLSFEGYSSRMASFSFLADILRPTRNYTKPLPTTKLSKSNMFGRDLVLPLSCPAFAAPCKRYSCHSWKMDFALVSLWSPSQPSSFGRQIHDVMPS